MLAGSAEDLPESDRFCSRLDSVWQSLGRFVRVRGNRDKVCQIEFSADIWQSLTDSAECLSDSTKSAAECVKSAADNCLPDIMPRTVNDVCKLYKLALIS